MLLKKFLPATIVFAFALVFSASFVWAIPPLSSATLDTPGTDQTLFLPPAVDNANVISLGTAFDSGSGQMVEGLAIIHRQKNPAKPGGAKPGTGTCYGYLSQGARWKTVEPWIVNPANTRGLGGMTVFNILENGVAKWENATDGNVTNSFGIDVFGPGGSTSATLVADTASPDNLNEVYFADITGSGTIAVTIVWGIWGGPIPQRQLVEWDQIYDDVSFDWSAESSGVSGKMDFDNIATHELGHSFGMGDLYNTCTQETMYGYAGNGETQKRDLNSGDISGIDKLY
ncbi:MAG: matrixin family metalloprotease [bacterium]|nr:matrixin family metalloprotease [bacterium]